MEEFLVLCQQLCFANPPLENDSTLLAGVGDHAKICLKGVGNTASADPRCVTFVFDAVANGALEGNDTRVVLSRGFEESMGPAGMRMRNKDDTLHSDAIDN